MLKGMHLGVDLGPLITSRGNARVQKLRAALHGRAARPGDLVALEGWHLLREAHRSGLAFETIFVRQGSEHLLQNITLSPQDDLHSRHWALLSHDVFDSAVSTGSPQGGAATWILREPALPSAIHGSVLVLEDLQDPGNLGTLLRSAEAFGASLVMATPATASPWTPKAMRASAGSVFRTPVQRAPLDELVTTLRAGNIRILAAVSSGATASSFAADLQGPCAIMIGNEGAGLSPLALALAEEHVRIPCSVESLNAAIAGSVLLYEAMRRHGPRQDSSRPASPL